MERNHTIDCCFVGRDYGTFYLNYLFSFVENMFVIFVLFIKDCTFYHICTFGKYICIFYVRFHVSTIAPANTTNYKLLQMNSGSRLEVWTNPSSQKPDTENILDRNCKLFNSVLLSHF